MKMDKKEKALSLKANLIAVFILISSFLYADVLIKGKVVNGKTKEALAFVNIGILNKNIGTVSDIDGTFQLKLEDQYNEDSLVFSMIGYTRESYQIIDFKRFFKNENAIEINLEAKNYEIKEVIISDQLNWKTKIIGNETTSTSSITSFSGDNLGAELGLRMKVKKHAKTYLEEFYFSIAYNSYDSLWFRLNIYSIKDDLPDKNLVPENIIIKTKIKNGVVTVDLRKYFITVEDDFIAALERLRDPYSIYTDTTSITISSKISFKLGYKVYDENGKRVEEERLSKTPVLEFSSTFLKSAYIRKASHGFIVKETFARPGFWMKVSYKKY